MSEFVLPEGWINVTLDDVAEWCSGGTPSRANPDYFNGDIPWVKTGDLGDKVIMQASEHITKAAIQNSSAKFFPRGSVVLAMYGATIGKTSILGIDATTNQACAVGQPRKATNTLFLYYLIRNEKDSFIAKGKGGAQPNISQTLIKEHEIFLPSFAEQQQIATILDDLLAQVDHLKVRLDGIPQILKRFRQSVLEFAMSGNLTSDWRELYQEKTTKQMMRDFMPLPKPARYASRSMAQIQGVHATAVGKPSENVVPAWDWIPIVDIARLESGHTPSRSHPEYWGGDIDWIGISDAKMNHAKTIMESEQKTNSLGLANSAARLLPVDTVCVSRTASVGYVVRLGKPMATSQDFVNWVPSRVINPDWLKWLFVAEKESLFRFGKGTTHTTIYFPEWLSLHLALPHKEEQTEIVRRVEQLFAYADQIEQRVKDAQARVNHLTQSILAKAFRGELTAEWRTQNPDLISGENSAEALLARIKAEREAVPASKSGRRKKGSGV